MTGSAKSNLHGAWYNVEIDITLFQSWKDRFTVAYHEKKECHTIEFQGIYVVTESSVTGYSMFSRLQS